MNSLEHRYLTVGGVKLHFTVAGQGDPVLLIHGVPQTWYKWKNIIPALAKHYTVIAPDYRGAGDSEKTLGNYDKISLMEDLRGIAHQLGFGKIRVVGHDMGAMIAYPYAAVHPDEVVQLVLMDAAVPGTQALADLGTDPRAWHINFHTARDLPEFLVAGREREYVTHFLKSRFTEPGTIPQEDIDVYVAAYQAPGAMRACFELYRAWERDIIDNKPYLERKLPMPVLTIGGEKSLICPALPKMVAEIAANGTSVEIAGAGHWLTEQNPRQVERYLLEFFESAG